MVWFGGWGGKQVLFFSYCSEVSHSEGPIVIANNFPDEEKQNRLIFTLCYGKVPQPDINNTGSGRSKVCLSVVGRVIIWV